MDTILKEKLIEIVRKYECIYNTKHKDYKNKCYKLLLWERIGTMLEIDGNKAKEMWRTLRDGYVRYKKQIAGKTGSGRKYYKYTWSAQMEFLDGTLELRPTSTNITAPQEAGSESPESRISRPVSSLPSLSPQRGPSHSETPPSPSHTASSTELLPSNSMHTNQQSLPPSAARTSVKRRNISTNLPSEGRTDKVLEYLQNKYRTRHEYDDVDHLFASYAKAFKKLSRRTQTELKITLAKLIAEAEITELESDTQINESPQSQLVYLSHAYSIISDESTQPIIAIDLSQLGQSTAEDLSLESAELTSETEEVSSLVD